MFIMSWEIVISLFWNFYSFFSLYFFLFLVNIHFIILGISWCCAYCFFLWICLFEYKIVSMKKIILIVLWDIYNDAIIVTYFNCIFCDVFHRIHKFSEGRTCFVSIIFHSHISMYQTYTESRGDGEVDLSFVKAAPELPVSLWSIITIQSYCYLVARDVKNPFLSNNFGSSHPMLN